MTPIRLDAKRSLGLSRVALFMGTALLLSSCSLWESTRSLWGHDPASAPAQQPAPEATPTPMPEPANPAPWVPPPPAPNVAPLLEPTPIEPLSDVAPQPLVQPLVQPFVVEPTPAPAPTPAPTVAVQATPSELAKGRYAIQVGVFLVAENAETIRTRIEGKLAADPSLKASDKIVRSLKKGGRTYVLVGDMADSHAAEFLAARLRLLLNQDVVVFQR